MRRIKQPHITPVAERLYRLDEDFHYYSTFDTGISKSESRQIVPREFIFDGASVPRLAWTVSGITPDGLIRAAAVIHDYLYEKKGRVPFGTFQFYSNGEWWNHARVYTRTEADAIFYDVMIRSGMNKFKAWIAYMGVRIGGRTYWNAD